MDSFEDEELSLQSELGKKNEVASIDTLKQEKFARKYNTSIDNTITSHFHTSHYSFEYSQTIGRPTANFDLLMQTDEDNYINSQSEAMLKDEIVKLMDFLCESAQNNVMLHPSFDDNGLCPEDAFVSIKPPPPPGSQSNISEGMYGSSKTILEVSQEHEDMTSKWKPEKFSLEHTIAIKNAALKKYESKSTALESSIEKLRCDLMESNELLSAKCLEVKSLKSMLQCSESELKVMKLDISLSLKQISKLKQKLDEQKFETELVRNEKEKALDEIARLHEELDNQLTICKDLERQCAFKTKELDKLRYVTVEGNEEVTSKKCKMVSSNIKENTMTADNCSGFNTQHHFPQMNVTGPYYKCDVSSESLHNVFPSHQRNFNFYNQSNIKMCQQSQEAQNENTDIDKENEKSYTQDSIQKNAPFLRVGLSRKSRIRRPLHDSTNN